MLYFDNLSRDTADIYLADGLTEELIVRLQHVSRLEVKSRFESQRFRGRAHPAPAALGRALNAVYLVTGSVQKAGPRVRLRVELVRSATGATVWSDAPERSNADILAIESEIASQVANAITGQLLPDERARLTRQPTRNAEAYDLYLRALEAANAWSEQGPRAALAYLDRAIALDSSFAPAWAAKAVAWSTLADAYVLPREAFTQARAAAEHALRLDSSLALAYAMLGGAVLALEYDGPRAIQLAQRALQLDSQVVWGYILLSFGHGSAGRSADALSAARRGWLVDTLDAVSGGIYLWTSHLFNQLDSMAAALPRMHATLATEDARAFDGLLRFGRRDYAEAARLLAWRYYGGFVAGEDVHALVALGRRDAARATLDSMVAARAEGYYNPMAVAKAFVALGEPDRAFEWLERAYEERTQWLGSLRQDRELEPLRGDPRFAAITARMRF